MLLVRTTVDRRGLIKKYIFEMLGLWVATWSDSYRGSTWLWDYITGKRHRLALWPRSFLRILTITPRVDICTKRRQRQFIPPRRDKTRISM